MMQEALGFEATQGFDSCNFAHIGEEDEVRALEATVQVRFRDGINCHLS